MNKYSVHSVTLPGFIWSSGMLKNLMKSTWRSSREQRALFLCLCSGSWVYDSEQDWVVVPALQCNELFVFQVHSWATQPPVGAPPQPPESLSLPDWVSARYQEHWGWHTAKSLLRTHCIDTIKGFEGFVVFFSWTAHPHFIAHLSTYTIYYLGNPVGLEWKHQGAENYKHDYSFTWNTAHWACVTQILQRLYWVSLQTKFILV